VTFIIHRRVPPPARTS